MAKKTPTTPKTDTLKLTALAVEDLRRELDARQAKPVDHLRGFDDATLIQEVKSSQKVIYGTDDRQDVFQLTQAADRNDADCVVALFSAGDLTNNGNGTSTLRTVNFGTSRNLCSTERFRNQPTGAFCSGFLVAADIIATAGHCINAGNVTTVRFVFGFRMRDANTAETIINNAEIYSGVSIIGRQEVSTGADWALVRINRAVTNHRIVPIRRAGRVPDNQALHVIGHPVGLPTKFAGGAAVRNNQPAAFFVANLDTYGGNSGSPVFNRTSHEVEGILVRGETDFVMQGSCRVSLVCPTTGCRGEDCTRTTEFSNLVPRSGSPVLFKKAVDDPPVSLKRIRDDAMLKRLRDRFVVGKPIRDIFPLTPGGGRLPFSLATAHHAKFSGEPGGDADQAAMSHLAAVEQEWLELQAALTQARANAAQAEADVARLEESVNSFATAYADLLQPPGGEEGGPA